MKKLLALAGLFVLCAPMVAQAEMIITTKSGKQYRLPIDGADISSIRFTKGGDSNAKPASNWRGTWKTSEGEMTLVQRGSSVAGRYKQDGGRIAGRVKGNKLTGFWAEKSSARRCTTKKLGTFYWGRITYTQIANGKQFQGKWGYCNSTPDGSWTGKR